MRAYAGKTMKRSTYVLVCAEKMKQEYMHIRGIMQKENWKYPFPIL